MSFNPKPGGDVKDYFSGNSNNTYNKEEDYWWSLSIANDGSSSLTFTVHNPESSDNDVTITVLAGEGFNDMFTDFNRITVNATDNYRLALRG
jgi:hypothetical protein